MPKGTTSACAENTYTKALQSPDPWNYLRVRGEYGFVVRKGRKHVELPPRARRIRESVTPPRGQHGTTSACAENTLIASLISRKTWNYLRVRGEYHNCAVYSMRQPELPPRARRILSRPATVPGWAWNYLRVRGEYTHDIFVIPRAVELPPRARRIRPSSSRATERTGTTSACAENTAYIGRPHHGHGNYLRVRGEYLLIIPIGKLLQELPPRARRILRRHIDGDTHAGTTSACAENTCCSTRTHQ